jgi:hypothetical protein
MLGLKSFESASRTLLNIEMVNMSKKEPVIAPMATAYEIFCSLAA